MNLNRKTVIALLVAVIILLLAICLFVWKSFQPSSSSQMKSASNQKSKYRES